MWWLVTGTCGLVAFAGTWTLIAASGVEPGSGFEEEILPAAEVPIDFDPLTLGGPPRPTGAWEWVLLQGGECLTGLPTPGSPEVTVTDCDAPHYARYLSPIILSRDPGADYPGATALADQAREHCSALTATTHGIGSGVTDLLARGLYAPEAIAWQRGQRVVGCVVYREGGALLPVGE